MIVDQAALVDIGAAIGAALFVGGVALCLGGVIERPSLERSLEKVHRRSSCPRSPPPSYVGVTIR
ncbi:MAG: hypothetical protein WDM85_11640 [Caulobacteraceae bacterium]